MQMPDLIRARQENSSHPPARARRPALSGALSRRYTRPARKPGWLALVVLGLFTAACNTAAPPTPAATSRPSAENASPRPAHSAPGPSADRQKVEEFLHRIDGFSPRPPGSANLERLKAYLQETLKSYGLSVQEEPFEAPVPGGPARMSIILAEKRGNPRRIVYLASHIDTKKLPGREFRGANDSTSSTAALLEIARLVAAGKTDCTVRFLFLDGEEAYGSSITSTDGLFGSRHHAATLSAAGQAADVSAFILLDMIGDRDLALVRDANSAPELLALLAACAQDTGNASVLGEEAIPMIDDHVPFAKLGIPALDVIDFSYGPGNSYWHTTSDVLENISAESVARVSDCVLCLLARLDDSKAR